MHPAKAQNLNPGSRWQRWDPHIHAPGTVLNDQFRGDWNAYLTALEKADPPIVAIGATDYYLTRTYKQVADAKKSGRLQCCKLIFPNVEMRLAVGTVKGNWANIHLLVSPENEDHLTELHRFLARLTFEAFGTTFTCTPDELILLGKRSDPAIKDDETALKKGCEQFKVNFTQLKAEYKKDRWAEENILVAVAGGADGTSGIRDAADQILRQEIETFAHIVFSSTPSQRPFWLGEGILSADDVRARYGCLKPCLHGSDAHTASKVGVPFEERYSWIKGEATFDALRHACIDPSSRAFVGAFPPASASPSQVISCIELVGANWAKSPILLLNPGLVAIIGARGSGKTALADMIAAGCHAVAEPLNPQSFLVRAREELSNTIVKITWGNGSQTTCKLNDCISSEELQFPRARYLSQQFVEDLCSATGMTDALLREIERVVFEAHDLSSKENTVSFSELLELRASRYRMAREREEAALNLLSGRIGSELEKDRVCPEVDRHAVRARAILESYKKDRDQLVVKGSEIRMARLGELTAAAEKVRGYLRAFRNREQALLALRDEVGDVRRNQAPEKLRLSQERFRATGIEGDEWQAFLLDYKGDVDTSLVGYIKKVEEQAEGWRGKNHIARTDLDQPLLSDEADLNRQSLSSLEAEIARLEKLINIDKVAAQKFAAISRKILEENVSLQRIEEKLKDCQQAKERAESLIEERNYTYLRVFEAILGEQNVLEELYAPLMERLDGATGTLSKLSFSVKRVADVARWAEYAQTELLDLKRTGPFRGKGSLQQIAEELLNPAWETGSAEDIREAMKRFRSENQNELLSHSRVSKASQEDFRAWLKKFAHWIFDTSHISIQYSIDYDGLDIRKLSPGTRGVVLLLLYLVLDNRDDRPLIIDQPEENLDPLSIYQELVGLFVDTKIKRQVIMVTHNANLVINTDADQIIVATSGPQPGRGLPSIHYQPGGLENADIRKAVCDILEGGDVAFQERARRLRVTLRR